MLVRAIAGIDHAGLYPPGPRQSLCGARRVVTQHDRLRTHRLQSQGRVLQALTLGHARPFCGEGDHVSGQALGRGLEGESGSSGILEEEIGDGPSS